MIVVTGGAGFIGSNFVREWMALTDEPVIVLDKLTYAGNPDNVEGLQNKGESYFICGDIGDSALVETILHTHRPRAVINFAAESHVDRSIHGPDDFIETNIVGTFRLLETVRGYWERVHAHDKNTFRFLHVSTDEVYGSLSSKDPAFSETTPYAPNSPYSASKAASDHLVRAWYHTYGLPVVTTNCSNNYGPRQFPEKLIPLMIMNALKGATLPVYGDGMNVRDWLYVSDHCSAIRRVLEAGRLGETYNIGGNSERTNLQVIDTICSILDRLLPRNGGTWHYRSLVRFVTDRPGHDRRYAIDASKIRSELGWEPEETFESGMEQTVRWYLDNPEWVRRVVSGEYRNWMEKQYGEQTK
jgi:dTDP-glucose 4,6-dehydratase